MTDRGMWTAGLVVLTILIGVTYIALNQEPEEEWTDITETTIGNGTDPIHIDFPKCAIGQGLGIDLNGTYVCIDFPPSNSELIEELNEWLGKLDRRLVQCEMDVDEAHNRISEILGIK